MQTVGFGKRSNECCLNWSLQKNFSSSSQNAFHLPQKKSRRQSMLGCNAQKRSCFSHQESCVGAFFCRVSCRVACCCRWSEKRENMHFLTRVINILHFWSTWSDMTRKISGDMKMKQVFSLLVHVTMVVMVLMMRIMQVFPLWST